MRKLFDVNVAAMLALGLALIVFFADLATPAEYLLGIFYLIPLLVSVRTSRPLFVVEIAVLSSVLVLLDTLLREPVEVAPAGSAVLANKALLVGLLWIFAISVMAWMRWRQPHESEPVQAHDDAESASHEALWALIEASPLAMVTLDAAGNVKMWNPAAEKMFGWQQSEVLGKPHPAIPLEKQREFHKFCADSLQGASFTGVEVDRTSRGGARLNISLSTALLRKADNRVVSILEIMEDITARKQAENDRNDARDELLRRQRLETQLVEEKLEKARRAVVATTRLATVGTMSAQLAHDLRNPLGAIRNAAYFLQRKVPESEPIWPDYLHMIEREVETCDQIITNLLDVTRNKEISRKRIDLADLVQSAVTRLKSEPTIDWQLDFKPRPFLIDVDPVQMRQVFDNLLKNALDAVEGKGQIAVCARRDNPEWDLITVTDSGPGVAAARREEVFELFYTTKAKGTGLGLAICRQIIERHSGRISVANTDGAGAMFEIRLPRLAAAVPGESS